MAPPRISSLSLSSSSSATTPTTIKPSSDLAVIGCGVLGTSLCRQLLRHAAFEDRVVTAITKTTTRHEEILSLVGEEYRDRFVLRTWEDARSDSSTFRDVIFCAPPSGFEDYAGSVKDAVEHVWRNNEDSNDDDGRFVFTSSGGVFAGKSGETVSERSEVSDSPRALRLLNAEEACLQRKGTVLRLAGLYTLERGAHNYWLSERCALNGGVQGREDGWINLLHYDDAAYACVRALLSEDVENVKGGVFLMSDGQPMTRREICESALKHERYSDDAMPAFQGTDTDDLGKIYDGSWTNRVLKFEPIHAKSFDEFITSG